MGLFNFKGGSPEKVSAKEATKDIAEEMGQEHEPHKAREGEWIENTETGRREMRQDGALYYEQDGKYFDTDGNPVAHFESGEVVPAKETQELVDEKMEAIQGALDSLEKIEKQTERGGVTAGRVATVAMATLMAMQLAVPDLALADNFHDFSPEAMRAIGQEWVDAVLRLGFVEPFLKSVAGAGTVGLGSAASGLMLHKVLWG
jgi:hypothetical protein